MENLNGESHSGSQIEAKKLNLLIEKNKEIIGDFNLVSVGESGFVLQNEMMKPQKENDWVFFDYDDTLAAYTDVKIKRQNLYADYLQKELKVNISLEDIKKILEITDKFCRWESNLGEGKHYHVAANMISLSWATDQLNTNKKNIDETITKIQTTLDRIKDQLKGSQKGEEGDPFYFKNNKLILCGKVPWSSKIENIFQETVINPPLFKETVNVIKEIKKPENYEFNTGIFTYGDPYFQFLKIVNFLKENPDLSINQIWLTKKPKGQFVEDLIKAQLGPIEQHKPVMVIFDDDPKELKGLSKLNELESKSGFELVTIRSKQSGIKLEKDQWISLSKFGEIDFTSKEYLAKDILKIFLINRYLSIIKNRSIDDNVLEMEKNRLIKLGVNIEDIS